ncbi:hypothetical protein D3C81_2307340 [compost metagenome]
MRVDRKKDSKVNSKVPMMPDTTMVVRKTDMPLVMTLTGVKMSSVHPVTEDRCLTTIKDRLPMETF